MSPEERATLGVLGRLRREIAHDVAAMARHAEDCRAALERWEEPERSYVALAAVGMHAWYTALEALLERVVRQLDGDSPRGEAWHRDLLFQATAELPGLRPAILPEALTDDLLEILGFRHFFRHAYRVDLDPDKLGLELRRLVRIEPAVGRALDEFDKFLARAAQAVRDS